ncbi:MAG: hypothetical protein ABL891_00495 [Burkholderiales bacterium]
MKMLGRLCVILTVALVGACAHPINIAPKAELSDSAGASIQKSVAYVISQEDRDREVTTPGGGGDLVSYFLYRDLEAGIFQALSTVFSRVTLVRKINDAPTLTKNNVSLVLVPKITASSSSDGVLTWPPTQFSITIEYYVQDITGTQVYKNLTMGNGRATFSEFSGTGDFGLSGRRAAEDVLRKLKAQIAGAKELK